MYELYISNWIVQILAAILTSFGFGIIFKVKGKNLLHTGIAGGISWFFYLAGKELDFTVGVDYFLATLFLSLYAEIVARKMRTTVTAIMIPALIPLAPGGGIYYTMYNLIEKNYPMALEKGITTFIMAGAMAVGIFTAAHIMRISDKYRMKNGD
ncbi:hypothetical protein IX317_001302 [Fusobacterium sp. DD29]|uniref:threonine/serine exporter family protein n=1 Tax=unclassified Fusobacterium TaxID=2648384 RepID=UPI001B8ADF19|nr:MULTISPECIES: threonine/serine exporter family protein [unclassified Fusobacterium]MBR8701797.1 hypothetical protein [Fusobacterium sp. DD45]MBR8711578.1 hypothetical protein [Fusobacterium sp. DD28]MBR8749628.1 hypothetical protein [Fusobacterium sp. DD29]MBR8752127.1 hypothetical protein [Fusobacterium sp. DD26]MBR8761910.1 hypothetical protein [Fusobacterium sp. DD25]